jgi:hypothetical protein
MIIVTMVMTVVVTVVAIVIVRVVVIKCNGQSNVILKHKVKNAFI